MRRYIQGTVDRYDEIPEILERERYDQEPLSTGTSGSPVQIEDWIVYPQENVTAPTVEKLPSRGYRNFFIYSVHKGVTWGSLEPFLIPRFPRLIEDITKQAREAIQSADNQNGAGEANAILDLINDQLRFLGDEGLPPIRTVELDDGSLLIEWIFDHFRFGFNIEVDSDQSGYFLVSDRSTGEIRSSGFLRGLNLEALIRSLLILVLNS
jgi:hypothetical protein